jgi:hypothetical protein
VPFLRRTQRQALEPETHRTRLSVIEGATRQEEHANAPFITAFDRPPAWAMRIGSMERSARGIC